MMKLQFGNVVCVALVCLASFLGSEGASKELFRTIELKSANRTNRANRATCYQDSYKLDYNVDISGTQNCQDCCQLSYAYQTQNGYLKQNSVEIYIYNIEVNCPLNDLILISPDSQFSYCSQPNQRTFTGRNWVGIERLGNVKFYVGIRFKNNDQPITNPTTTVAPVTNPTTTVAPITNPPSTGVCGVPKYQPKNQEIKLNEFGLKIVGGEIANKHSWPWMVGFTQGGSLFCGGTLINDQWILTAAHCITDPADFKVNLGDHNINDNTDGQTIRSASLWFNHEQYNRNTDLNDIALVKLSSKITFSDTIIPVCLPGIRTPNINISATVTGWGLTVENGENTVSELRQVTVPINIASKCSYNNDNTFTLPVSQICAGNKPTGQDSCQGDSGGPLVVKDGTATDSPYYIAGVVSWGYGCGGGGVYTNVNEYDEWISRTISNN